MEFLKWCLAQYTPKLWKWIIISRYTTLIKKRSFWRSVSEPLLRLLLDCCYWCCPPVGENPCTAARDWNREPVVSFELFTTGRERPSLVFLGQFQMTLSVTLYQVFSFICFLLMFTFSCREFEICLQSRWLMLVLWIKLISPLSGLLQC